MLPDGGGMNVKIAAPSVRSCASALGAICVLLLIPALPLAYFAAGWLDLAWPSKLGAAALAAAPLPLATGAAFSWKAARHGYRRDLAIAALSTLATLPLAVVLWAWGGRMLI